ncbi:thioredoxin domain-containing protein [Roseospira navarrensis]|uniref:thioredoxin domain-containing protein n=1 Tax=Roseospira navarrensis TaxID=140058 RepID=UPI0014797E19
MLSSLFSGRPLSTVAVLLLAGGLTLAHGTPARAQADAPEAAADSASEATDATEAATYQEHILGDPDAPVQILEFSSFTCGHCATFHQDHLPELKDRYIDTGKANLRLVDFPLDNLAGAVSLITRCAPSERYQAFVETFYGDPAAWQTRTPRESLTSIARLGGMSKEDVDACLQNETLYREILDRQEQARERYNITGTPTFVINGTKHTGSYSAESLSEAIDEALEDAGG